MHCSCHHFHLHLRWAEPFKSLLLTANGSLSCSPTFRETSDFHMFLPSVVSRLSPLYTYFFVHAPSTDLKTKWKFLKDLFFLLERPESCAVYLLLKAGLSLCLNTMSVWLSECCRRDAEQTHGGRSCLCRGPRSPATPIVFIWLARFSLYRVGAIVLSRV